ncbi:hemerythrin domain-containing protein [Nocardia transvalensis]|uniref:hemerythrin domain-containing protein n=1 Tax=Nocardia transvalensis TaxID=37333 RepID=UPI00189617F7|nr:hemerythrin domain-containing protein [Nocardia transvalensis]MBF6327819.1 hemerythrin domain-containing protein [Nocardia transvalensis]
MYPETDPDVVTVLLGRHSRIQQLAERIRAADGDRRAQFDEFVRTFAAHEYSEHQVVHPAARACGVPDEAVDLLMLQEDELEKSLSALCARGIDAPGWDVDFSEFASAAIVHCAQEEQQEYAQLLAVPRERQRELGRAVLDAEAVAPTRPHPAARRSGFARLCVAPVLALVDRLRDGVRRRPTVL